MNTNETRRTEYLLSYKGVALQPPFARYGEVEAYVIEAAQLGKDPDDYTLQHRTVTYGPWAPTTLEMRLCPRCHANAWYVADYGAPGVGQAWRCENGHDLARVGGRFYDPSEGAHLLDEDDVR